MTLYATAAEIRTRYQRSGVDEFASFSDADLTQSLTAASAEIDSYRPAGGLSVTAEGVLRDKALTLARMLAHQDQALDDTHPIVRDGLAVRDWLNLLARGIISLPADVTDDVSTSSIAASTRTMTLDSALWGDYPT